MRYIRTTNNIAEFIETNDSTGQIINSMGFNFGEVYYLIKNKKVTFYLNDSEKPFDNFIWSLDIPFVMDGVTYEDEDTASAHLYNVFNDRFQEQLDELREDLEEEIGRSTAMDETLQEEIDDERERAISAETHLQDQVTELSGTVATFDGRITRNTNDISALTVTVNNEVVRSTNKDTEHDNLISALTDDVASLEARKQNNLTAGKYISIVDDVISADSNHVYRITQAAYDALPEIDPEGLYIIVDAEEVDLANYTPLSAFTAEVTRSTQKDIEHDSLISGYTTGLATEIQNRIAADNLLQDNLDNEIARAISAETEIANDLDAEEARALAAESALTDALNDEITRSTAKDAQHDSEISGLTTSLQNEITRSTSAETILHNEIVEERNRAISAETEIANDVDAEEARALLAEGALSNAITAETSARQTADNAISAAVDTKLAIADFNSYSATTNSSINSKLATSDFNSYSASTKNDIDAKLATSDFNTYSAATDNVLDNVYLKSETSGATEIANALANKQDTLVSTVNIKSINGESILGSGNIHIESEVSGITSGECQQMIDASIATKQNILTAGTGISIVNDVISVTAVSPSVDAYTKAESDAKFATITNFNTHSGDTTAHVTSAEKNTWNAKQNALTAGTGININGTTISAKIWSGTQAQYDALAVKDNDTLYLIY